MGHTLEILLLGGFYFPISLGSEGSLGKAVSPGQEGTSWLSKTRQCPLPPPGRSPGSLLGVGAQDDCSPCVVGDGAMLRALGAVGANAVGVPAAAALEQGVCDVQDVIAAHLKLSLCPPLQGQIDPDVEGVP